MAWSLYYLESKLVHINLVWSPLTIRIINVVVDPEVVISVATTCEHNYNNNKSKAT